MRKAYTGPNRVEREAQRREASFAAQLAKLAEERAQAQAKAKGKRWPPKPKRLKEKKIPSRQEVRACVSSLCCSLSLSLSYTHTHTH